VLLVFAGGACQAESEPDAIIIEITATFAPVLPSMMVETLAVTAFPTITPLPLESATPSPFPTVFPSLTATATPLEVSGLPAFPSATATFTPQGFNPTAIPALPTSSLVASPLPTLPTALPTLAPTQTLASNLPDAVQTIQPAAVSDLAPPPESLPLLNASRLGIQLHPFVTNEEWANALNLAKQLNIQWIKFQIPWEVAEPQPGQFSFEYERAILLVQEAHIAGYLVLVNVNRAPLWARPPGADPTLHGPPADPQALAAFITRLVTDIKPEFMEAIEIWNEPNLVREWQGIPMGAAEYMPYFAAGYQAAKAVDPDVVVVTAGLAPVGDVPGQAIDDRLFVAQMYQAGLLEYPEARLGVHPYGWANPPDARCCNDSGWADSTHFFMLETVESYRQIALENNDPTRQLWLTELGWGTFIGIREGGLDASPPVSAAFMERITPQQQADYVIRALELLQSEPYNDFVELKFLWNMNFATIENAITDALEQAGYSFLDEAGRPRPVFFYLLNTRKYKEVAP
jgi:hypothetical protein